MSLTSHIKDESSPVRRWLTERFPDVPVAARELRATFDGRGTNTLSPSDGKVVTTVGVAVDYRVRLYFAEPVVDHLIAAAGASIVVGKLLDPGAPAIPDRDLLYSPAATELAPVRVLRDFGAYVARHPTVAARLEPPVELRLARYCFVLGLYEEVFRTGRIWPTSPLARLGPHATGKDVLALVPDIRIREVAAIGQQCFEPLAPYFGQPFALNPTFAGSRSVGGADADLVLNHCLVEVKTTINPRLDPLWLLQLLGYVILDWDDAHEMDAIGVLLARQAVLPRWPLDDVMRLAGARRGVSALDAFRADFRQRFPPPKRTYPITLIEGNRRLVIPPEA